MRLTIIAISVTIGLANAGACLAEDLVQIYDLAVQSDPVIKGQEQNLYATREARPQARGLLLPNFGVTSSATYRNDKTDGIGTASFGTRSFNRNDTYSTRGVSIGITQPVYDRALWIGLDQTNDTIAAAEAEYKNQQIDLMVRTTEAYFAVLEAADAVRVQEALLRANERQLEQSKQRFEVGLVAITDVNESQAAYDLSRANLITSENELNNRWEALRRIVGPISLPLARLGDKLPLSPPQPNDIDQWAQTALQNNYGVLSAKEQVDAAKKTIEIQRSGHYPTLDMQAGYGLDRSGAEFGTDSDSAFVTLNLNIPIYEGGIVTSRTRQAGYDFRAAQEGLDSTRRQVIESVKNAFRGILSSISDVKARQAAIVSTRSALESTQAGLEVGTRTQVDVLNAQRNLFQAEFDYLVARYQYIINGVLLHQATSTLSRDVLVKGNAWLNPKDTVPPPAY